MYKKVKNMCQISDFSLKKVRPKCQIFESSFQLFESSKTIQEPVAEIFETRSNRIPEYFENRIPESKNLRFLSILCSNGSRGTNVMKSVQFYFYDSSSVAKQLLIYRNADAVDRHVN